VIADLLSGVAVVLLGLFLWNIWPPATALVAAATLLFIGLLGLIQVRRTMVPLERLIAGTRRLSEHDYSARVSLRPGDEFGELANSFNHMAERIDHQMQALRVQSSIDHEILNGLNVARVLQRVAHRLEQVVPGATACVVEFDRTSRLLARVHRAGTAMSIIGLPRADAICLAQMPIEETVLCNDPPGWLLGLTTGSSHRWVRCARSGDELLAMLVIGAGDHAIDDSDTQREIAELCDRVSVTLASADRERRLLERATHDNLTGLANRAGLYESIDAQLAEDLPASFSVLFVDLDRFKEVNDSMGHQIGDEVLREFASRVAANVRGIDLACRYGGEEFAMILPHIDRDQAERVAERVRAAQHLVAERFEGDRRWRAEPFRELGKRLEPAAAAGPREHRQRLLVARRGQRVELARQLRDRFIPRDFFELARAARAGPLQRTRQPIGMKRHLNRRLAARAASNEPGQLPRYQRYSGRPLTPKRHPANRFLAGGRGALRRVPAPA
jgi:diguanylate cyclase (GGDEF)-like protein